MSRTNYEVLSGFGLLMLFVPLGAGVALLSGVVLLVVAAIASVRHADWLLGGTVDLVRIA